jgi:hypothetical protein
LVVGFVEGGAEGGAVLGTVAAFVTMARASLTLAASDAGRPAAAGVSLTLVVAAAADPAELVELLECARGWRDVVAACAL